MRDIRDDLRERIAAEEKRREPLARALAGIDVNLTTLKNALAMEEARHAPQDAFAAQIEAGRQRIGATVALMGGVIDLLSNSSGVAKAAPIPTRTLITFLMERLSEGPSNLDGLREAAEAAGYFTGGAPASPGRMVHGALLNALKSGEVTRTSDERYTLTEKGFERVESNKKALALHG